MDKVAGSRITSVEVEESLSAAAFHRAAQAGLGRHQLDAPQSAQEQDALRLDVGELLGDIDAGRASQREENGRRTALCDGGNVVVPMRDDVAKPSLAIVSTEVKGVAVGNDVRTVRDEKDGFESNALLTDVALSVALLRGVPDVAQTFDVPLLKSRLVIQHAETSLTSGRVRRVVFKQDEFQEMLGIVRVAVVVGILSQLENIVMGVLKNSRGELFQGAAQFRDQRIQARLACRIIEPELVSPDLFDVLLGFFASHLSPLQGLVGFLIR